MKKIGLLLLSALLLISVSVGVIAFAAEQAEEKIFPESLTVDVENPGRANMWGDSGFMNSSGEACGESIQITMKTAEKDGYFQHAEVGGNYYTHISLYTKLKGDKDYTWHTLKELNETKDATGKKYISEMHQRAEILIIRFESVWNQNTSTEFSPLDVKAVKFSKGMQWLVKKSDLNGDQWNDYPNGGAGEPSVRTGVNEDIVVQFKEYSKGSNNDVFMFYHELGEADTLAVKTQPAKVNYSIGETFDASGLLLTATVGGVAQDIPLNASMVSVENKTFTETGDQTVTVTYGGKSVEIPVTVAICLSIISRLRKCRPKRLI